MTAPPPPPPAPAQSTKGGGGGGRHLLLKSTAPNVPTLFSSGPDGVVVVWVLARSPEWGGRGASFGDRPSRGLGGPSLVPWGRGGGGEDIWWTAGTARGGTGHLGLMHTEPQRGRLRTACGQRRVDSKNSQTTPATTSTSSIRQLLGAADAQTAHPATFSTAPTHQLLGSANAETTPARAPAAVADRKQRPDATCEGKKG